MDSLESGAAGEEAGASDPSSRLLLPQNLQDSPSRPDVFRFGDLHGCGRHQGPCRLRGRHANLPTGETCKSFSPDYEVLPMNECADDPGMCVLPARLQTVRASCLFPFSGAPVGWTWHFFYFPSFIPFGQIFSILSYSRSVEFSAFPVTCLTV